MSEILEKIELDQTISELFKRALVRQSAANEAKHSLANAEELFVQTKKNLFKKLKTLIENSFEKEVLKAELLKPEIVFCTEDEEDCALIQKIIDAILSEEKEIKIRLNFLPSFLNPVLLSRFFKKMVLIYRYLFLQNSMITVL